MSLSAKEAFCIYLQSQWTTTVVISLYIFQIVIELSHVMNEA